MSFLWHTCLLSHTALLLCIICACQPVPTPSQAIVTTTGVNYGDTTTCTCSIGYHVVTGDAVRTCGDGGVWSGSQPTCTLRWQVLGQVSVSNGGSRGTWGQPEYCEFGTYAYGYALKVEAPGSGDDSALNAVKLRCKALEGTLSGTTITSLTERWGDWSSFADCNNNEFITGFVLQVQGYQGIKDDTTANFAQIKCRNFAATSSSYDVAVPPGSGLWGTYGAWSSQCGANAAVCGLRTRVHAYEGLFGDDTSLNDITMYCCA